MTLRMCGAIGARALKLRFEGKFHRPAAADACWIWTAGTDNNGFGQMYTDRGPVKAHRAAWTIYCGPIPAGMLVLQSCGYKLCVNPRHLGLGTREDIAARMRENGTLPVGSEKGGALLTRERVVEIRREFRKLRRELAARYGVGELTVSAVERRKNWAWVDAEEEK